MAELLREVLQRCRGGDHGAATILVQRFEPVARGLATALLLGDEHLAQDAVQEAFVKALASLDELREPGAFPGWLRQIVRTECHRLSRRRRPGPLPESELAASADPPPVQAQRSETRALVRAALAALPPVGREAAELFYLREQSCEEVAAALGVPEGTVKRRLHDARAKLRQMLLALSEPEAEERR